MNNEQTTADQRTEEWVLARMGKFTASCFVDVLAVSKKDGKPLKAQDDLMWRLAVERLSGVPHESASAYALRYGQDVEPYALAAFEVETGKEVMPSGFILHKEFDFVGCSPDGLIRSMKEGLEAKSPANMVVHAKRFTTGMDEDIKPQVQGSLWVTGFDRWNFISYDPRQIPSHRLLIHVIERDEPYIKTLEERILMANEKVNNLVELLKNSPSIFAGATSA